MRVASSSSSLLLSCSLGNIASEPDGFSRDGGHQIRKPPSTSFAMQNISRRHFWQWQIFPGTRNVMMAQHAIDTLRPKYGGVTNTLPGYYTLT